VTDPKIRCPFPQCSNGHTVNTSKSESEKDKDGQEECHSVACWKTHA
jgi:hypothetical protein